MRLIMIMEILMLTFNNSINNNTNSNNNSDMNNQNSDNSNRQYLRPDFSTQVSLLRSSLLRFVDSTISGKIPKDMRIPPLRIKIMLSTSGQTFLVSSLSEVHR